MTTTTTLAVVETALAGIGRAAIERARNGKEFAIQARLRAYSDELRAHVADLIARKPDPAAWTPDEHAIFIRAAEAPTGFDVRNDTLPNAPAPAFTSKPDQEIPF